MSVEKRQLQLDPLQRLVSAIRVDIPREQRCTLQFEPEQLPQLFLEGQ